MTIKRIPIKKKIYRPNPGTNPLGISRYLAWVMREMLDGRIPIDQGKAQIYAQKVRLAALQQDFQLNTFMPFRMELEMMKQGSSQDEDEQYADIEVY